MRAILASLLVGMIATWMPGLQAQGEPQTGKVSGSLADSTTGFPVLRGWVCVRHDPTRVPAVGNCGRTDTLGRFLVDNLPIGKVLLSIVCNPRSRRANSPAMDHDDLQVDVHRDGIELGRISIDATLCDQRPMIHRSGEFIGYYSRGFEASLFRWSGDTTLKIWVAAPRSTVGGTIEWPAAIRETRGACTLVRWFGALVGPGRYGHLGGSDYEFRIDSVAEIREAPDGPCSG